MSIELVKEFHKLFDCAINQPVTKELLEQRLNLITEEYFETLRAGGYTLNVCDVTGQFKLYKIGELDKKEFAKELVDLEYVTLGTSIAFGLPHDEVMCRTHENNLSKIHPDGTIVKRADGKILKPPTYKPVDLSDIIKD